MGIRMRADRGDGQIGWKPIARKGTVQFIGDSACRGFGYSLLVLRAAAGRDGFCLCPGRQRSSDNLDRPG